MAKRSTLVRLAGASAAMALVAGATAAQARPTVVRVSAPITDLSAATNPTDGVHAQLVAAAPGDGRTYVALVLTGLDPAVARTTFGAHVHKGACVAGDGAAAGPHYNTGSGGPPSRQNEVWLDFTVRPGGVAVAQTVAAFEIVPGMARSVVIHALPTQEGTGLAGARMACLPAPF